LSRKPDVLNSLIRGGTAPSGEISRRRDGVLLVTIFLARPWTQGAGDIRLPDESERRGLEILSAVTPGRWGRCSGEGHEFRPGAPCREKAETAVSEVIIDLFGEATEEPAWT